MLAALLIAGCSFGVKAQTVNAREFFDKCSDNKSFTTVLVKKELLKKADITTLDMMDVKSIFNKLDVIGIVTAENKNSVSKLAKLVKDYFDTNLNNGAYNTLMSVAEDGEQTKILQFKKPASMPDTKSDIKPLLVRNDGKTVTALYPPSQTKANGGYLESGQNEFIIIQRESAEMTVVLVCGKLSINDIDKLKLL